QASARTGGVGDRAQGRDVTPIGRMPSGRKVEPDAARVHRVALLGYIAGVHQHAYLLAQRGSGQSDDVLQDGELDLGGGGKGRTHLQAARRVDDRIESGWCAHAELRRRRASASSTTAAATTAPTGTTQSWSVSRWSPIAAAATRAPAPTAVSGPAVPAEPITPVCRAASRYTARRPVATANRNQCARWPS